MAVKYAEQALESDPKLYEAREVLARVALEDNNEAKAREEANKAVAISPEALDAMAILATADWLNDKPARASQGLHSDHVAVDRQDLQDQSALRRSLRHRRALLRHQPHATTEGIQYYRKALESSRRSRARAASWESI